MGSRGRLEIGHDRIVPSYPTADPGEALDRHLRWFFDGHTVVRRRWSLGPIDERIPRFFVYEIGPGPRWSRWTYVSSGCWRATAQGGHGLEFALSTTEADRRHVEIVTIVAYYHAGPHSQRLDLGHTVPIGAPWTAAGCLDHLLVSLPYAYGPQLESLVWHSGHARLLALIPITTAERDFKARHGTHALEQLLDDQGVDFSNPGRVSVV